MKQLVYDGSLEGFLTSIFEIYERKLTDCTIACAGHVQPILLGESSSIISDPVKAARVWSGLKKKISGVRLNELFKTFLSERIDRETIMLEFIRYAFSSSGTVDKDYSNRFVLLIAQIAKQVHREKHRMEAFIRFQRTRDDLYYASIEPDFNVLPLIVKHFKDRYADQHWIIHDKRRNYGIQYDKNTGIVVEVHVELNESRNDTFLPVSIVHEEEIMYQGLWKEYFTSVNISPRKNTKLHVRHVPLRYWKYLTEKR